MLDPKEPLDTNVEVVAQRFSSQKSRPLGIDKWKIAIDREPRE